MAYTRRQTQDGVTVMNKDLYDNLQNGIEENRKINNLPDSIINVSSIGADPLKEDNSSFFQNGALIVEDGVYKIDKQTIYSCIEEKILGGNGSIKWKDWSTLTPIERLSGEIPISLIKDDIYTSMNLPSECQTYMSSRVNPSLGKRNPEGYNNLVGIGAVYQVTGTTLPDEFDICLGKFKTLILKDEVNATWEVYEEFNYPPQMGYYKLPWTLNESKEVPQESIEDMGTYLKIHVTKEDLDTQVLHFFGKNSLVFDTKNIVGIVVMYDIWSETPGIEGKLSAAIGADQRAIGTELPVSQAFSGKNWLVTNQCRTIIGHNIETDLYYDLIKIQGKSPNVCKELFNKDIEYKTNRFEPLVVTFPYITTISKESFLEIFSYKYSFNNTNQMSIDLEFISISSNGDLIDESYNVFLRKAESSFVRKISKLGSVSSKSKNPFYVKSVKDSSDIEHIYIMVDKSYTYTTVIIKNITCTNISNLLMTKDFEKLLYDKVYNGSTPEVDWIYDIEGEPSSEVTLNNFLQEDFPVELNSTDIQYNYSCIVNGFTEDFQSSDFVPSKTQSYWGIEYKYWGKGAGVRGEQTWTCLKDTSPEKYIRTLYNGVWSSYKQIF